MPAIDLVFTNTHARRNAMSSQAFESTITQDGPASEKFTQNETVQKFPFHQPLVGPLRHILQETGQSGKSNEYDSYSDNRT